MKLIEFKEYDNLKKNKSLNKKKVIILIIIGIIITLTVIFFLIYMLNNKFRNWADMHILFKTVSEGKIASVDIDQDEETEIFAYDKYIALLKDNQLNIYNSSGKQTDSIDVKISNPVYNANGKYLVIAEKDKQRLSLISGTKEKWNTEIDGNISKIAVNENGYVSVICTGTTYKSIIIVYNQEGKQLITTYIPNNVVIDSAISSDNRYLSYAEIDTSGTFIKSTVKTIEIVNSGDTSNIEPTNSYEMENSVLVTNLRYQGSKNLICMCNNGIYLLSDGNKQELVNFEKENTNFSFAGIDLINSIYSIEESTEEIKNQSSLIKILNTGTQKNSSYTINGIAKNTYSAGNSIAINLGNEVYIINTSGKLKKKYIANEEIRDIAISDRLAVIRFKDKIEILVL